MDYDKLIERLSRYSEPVIAYKLDGDFAAAVMEAKAELEFVKYGRCAGCSIPITTVEQNRDLQDAPKLRKEVETLRADLARVTAERDAAVEAVKNMAEYIVCAGRVDCFLCDEISQEHHLKYQPKNDGNYDNEPCYKCIEDWFLQGHEWRGNCW